MESENLIENARTTGEYLMKKVSELNHPAITDIRGRGLMIGIDLAVPQKDVRARLITDHHIFTGCSGTHTLRLLPPLCITRDQADQFIKALSQAI